MGSDQGKTGGGVADVGMIKTVKLDKIWARAKRWAKENGHRYDSSNVHGVAPL